MEKTAGTATEIDGSKAHIIVELIEYAPHSIVSKNILHQPHGDVIVSSFAVGEDLAETTCPYDSYIQIIDGKAELEINDTMHYLNLGEGILIPAQTKHCFHAEEKFKMISTIIRIDNADQTK